jgi:hypothetical protein
MAKVGQLPISVSLPDDFTGSLIESAFMMNGTPANSANVNHHKKMLY